MGSLFVYGGIALFFVLVFALAVALMALEAALWAVLVAAKFLLPFAIFFVVAVVGYSISATRPQPKKLGPFTLSKPEPKLGPRGWVGMIVFGLVGLALAVTAYNSIPLVTYPLFPIAHETQS